MSNDSQTIDQAPSTGSALSIPKARLASLNRYGGPIAIFTVALVLRVWAIATPLNTDEAKWLSRGAEFIHHLLAGDWGETYTTPHPGVPNMWVIGIGMELNRLLGQVSGQWQWVPPLDNMPQSLLFPDTLFPIHWYILPRLLQALISSVCMVGFYRITQRLMGHAIALLATVILLFEPFFLSYQRFITTDALQTNFGVLGLLGLVYYLQCQYFQSPSQVPVDVKESLGSKRAIWSGAAVMMGLAIAAKLLTLLVIPGLLLWLLVMGIRYRSSIASKRLALDLLRWSGVVLLTIVLIWPALWTQPGYTLNRVVEGLMDEDARTAFFFWGERTDTPGLLFYPVVLAMRLSPFMWLGLLGTGIIVVRPSLRRKTQADFSPANTGRSPEDLSINKVPDVRWAKDDRRCPSKPFADGHKFMWVYPSSTCGACGALALIALGYVGMLSLASTKIDRYISLVIPLLAILAAVGWLGITTALQTAFPQQFNTRILRSPQYFPLLNIPLLNIPLLKIPLLKIPLLKIPLLNIPLLNIPLLLALFLTTGQLTGLLPHMPYGLTYYNPILGGIQQAQRILMVGQGEGLDKMAQWLNQQPEAETMIVASWYRSVLAAYFHGKVSPFSSDALPDERFWTQSHRVVLYKNQLQRQLPSAEFLAYIRQQRSLHTVTEHGVEYAIAYPGPIALDSDLEDIQYPQSLKFGQRVQLQGYDIDWRSPDRPKTKFEAPKLVLTLYWDLLKPLPKDGGVYVEVLDHANQVVAQTTTPLFGGFYPTQKIPRGPIIRDVHVLSLPLTSHQPTPEIPDGYSIRVGWRSLASPTNEQPMFGRPKRLNH